MNGFEDVVSIYSQTQRKAKEAQRRRERREVCLVAEATRQTTLAPSSKGRLFGLAAVVAFGKDAPIVEGNPGR